MNSHASSLALFQGPKIETGIMKEEYIEYRPTGYINTGSIIEFSVPGTAAQYINLKKSKLFVKLRLLKGDGTPVVATDKVGLVNLSLHSLFRQVDITLNQVAVSNDVGVNYPYKSYIDILLNYGHDVKESLLQSELYAKDVAGYMDDADAPAGGNGGLLKRYSYTKDGKYVTLEGPIHHDMCQLDKLILNGVPIQIKLFPSLNPFRLMSSAADPKFTVDIDEVLMKVCHVTVNPNMIIVHNEMLDSKDAIYPFWKSIIRTYGIPEGNFTHSCEDILNGVVPSKVIVGFVPSEAYAGSYTKNPYNFENLKLNYLEFMVDGNSVPSRPFQPDFVNNDYVTEFNSLFFNKYPQNGGNFIERNDYSGGYALYCFDIEGQVGNDLMSIPRNGQTRLTARFATALPHPVTLIIYSMIGSVMRIDKARNVFMK